MGGKLKLSVHSHRGHDDDYHPRNLFDGKRTKTRYFSERPSKGDWIIFEIENASNFIPKMVIIRNEYDDWFGYGLKSIELSVAENVNGKYKRLAVIEGIQT